MQVLVNPQRLLKNDNVVYVCCQIRQPLCLAFMDWRLQLISRKEELTRQRYRRILAVLSILTVAGLICDKLRYSIRTRYA